MKKFLGYLELPNWITVLLVIILLLRIPSFFEPYSYGDEMIYLTLGEGIRQGIPLYSGLHDNKPPLIYILAAIAGSLTWFKIILAFWNLATVVLFWKLSEALFPGKKSLQKVATVFFGILTTIPLLEGNIVNAELFLIGPIIAAFLILFTKKHTPKNLAISGVLFSVATLFKVPAAFDLPVIMVFWLIINGLKKTALFETAKKSVFLILGFMLPIFLTFVWFFLAGSFKEYLNAAFLQNVGYLSSFRPEDTAKPFWIRNLPLFVRAGILLLGIAILYVKKSRLSKEFVFLTIWLLFTLFAVTLSERPYPHYLIQSIAAISFMFAILLTEKTLEQSLVIIPLSLALFVPVFYKFYLYPTSSYYLRFLGLATGRINREAYLSQFDGNTLRNYRIADFIVSSANKDEKIFVWGDSPPIYALTRHLPPIKYVAAYHIHDFANVTTVARELDKKKPKFIVILPDSPPSQITALLKTDYVLVNTIDNAEIWAHIAIAPSK